MNHSDSNTAKSDIYVPTAIIGQYEAGGHRYIVYILQSSEINEPNLHIGDAATFPECTGFYCMVSLLKPVYLTIGNKTQELDSTQLESLIHFLCSIDEDGDSIWRFTLKTWNKNNQTHKIPINYPIPNYTELPVSRSEK